MPLMRPALIALVAFAATPAAMAAPAILVASVQPLASHKAVYDMGLAKVRSSAGIVGAKGTMTYSFTNGCDGWTVETTTDLTMLQTEDGPVQTAWDFSAWESKAGDSYRFEVRNSRDGTVVEDFKGEARLLPGKGGSAVFRSGGSEETVVDLPVSTMFPTAHTVALLDAASKGQHFLAAPVFDGSGMEGAFMVSAGIAETLPKAAAHELPDNDLLAGVSWPMSLAFFDPDAEKDRVTPDFEVRLSYHLNGVAEYIVQDFGDFTLKGRMTELEPLPKAAC